MNKYYKAEMDRLLRFTTRLSGLLFLLPVAAAALVLYAPSRACMNLPPRFGPAIVVLVALAAALSAWLARGLAPRGYAVNDVELVIDRKLRPITLPLREIAGVSLLPDGALRGSLRLMGTSGFYGYYGLFWKRGVGRYRAYQTRLTAVVGVRTAAGLYTLTPDDPEDFIRTLNSLLGK